MGKPLVLLGGEPCTATKRVSHEMVRCLIPPGAGRRSVNVDVLGRNASVAGKFIYTPAIVTSVEHRYGPPRGGWKITIRGEGFGASSKDLQAAAEEGKRALGEEKKEEEEARQEENELARAKTESVEALANAMGEDAKAMLQLKNQTASMAEEERAELQNENATAGKLRAAEEAEELAEVGEGMEELEKTEDNVKNMKAANKLNGDISMRQAEIAKSKLEASLREVRSKAEKEEKEEEREQDAEAENNEKKLNEQKDTKNAAVETELNKVSAQAAKESVVSSDLADASAVAFLEVGRVVNRNRKGRNRRVQTLEPSDNTYEIQRGSPSSKPRRRIMRQRKTNNSSGYGVWVGGRPCLNVTWVSDKQIDCIVPPGAGSAKIIVRAPADQGVAAGGANLSVEYDRPLMRMIAPTSGENGGVYDIEIMGVNFGITEPRSIVAYVGEKKCLSTKWYSDSLVVCSVPPGTGSNLKVSVTINGKSSVTKKLPAFPSNPGLFSYEAPEVASVSPRDGPAVGGVTITIKGTGFGHKLRENLVKYTNATNSTVDVDVLVGDEACEKITVLSDSELKCITPPGLGSRKVAVVVNGQSSALENGPSAGTGNEGSNGAFTGSSGTGATGTGATGGVQDAE